MGSVVIFDELDNAIGQAVLLQRGEVEVLYPTSLGIYIALHFGQRVSDVLFRRQCPSMAQGVHEFQQRPWASLSAAQRVMVARSDH